MIIERDILKICPHKFYFKCEQYDEKIVKAADWCYNQFGNGVTNTDDDVVTENGVWEYWRFGSEGYTFYFKNKSDLMFFKLKWG
jgi:hypothetical protein